MDRDTAIPHIGSKAPDFTLPDQDGKNHTLSDYRGHWIFLYFYQGETPGCAKEACIIRDHFETFNHFNVKVFGVNADSTESHKQFAEKYQLPFVLLSDIHKKVLNQYGALAKWHPFGGKEEIVRISFLIDMLGDIEKRYLEARPKSHAEEVLDDLAAIQEELL